VGRPLRRQDGSVFVYAASPCQRSLSRFQVPWDSRPYFTVSVWRLPILLSPTTHRVTGEEFDPASTRGICWALSHDLHFITSGEPNRSHQLEQLVVIHQLSLECVFVNTRYCGNVCQSVATLWSLPAYPLHRESQFTEPLPSKWTSDSLCCYSGFQVVSTESLSSNGHIRFNILEDAFERYVISIRLQIWVIEECVSVHLLRLHCTPPLVIMATLKASWMTRNFCCTAM
jgi:hypothetical protein